MNVLGCALVGGAFGLACGLLRLPLPAPATLAGVLGVAGVTGGFYVGQLLTGWLR